MDSRAKQRLTGAVVLVALFVLLVPELLTGPKSVSTATTPAEEGLRRYTIDLDARQPANAPASTADVTLAPQPVAPSGAAAPAATPTPAPAPTPGPEPSSPVPASTPEPHSEPAPVAEARPQVAPLEPPKPASPARPEARSFVVQLGSFGSRANAERLVRDMTARGFATFIAPITTNGRELYRVRVGPTRDRASAEALATQLKRIGQSGSIVPIP
jgi:DedD protein